MHGFLYLCVWKVLQGRLRSAPQRNVSKIATANPRECKSALWKTLMKKRFEGHRKTQIHFSPFTDPGAEKWVTALQLHSKCWKEALLVLLLFLFRVINRRFFCRLKAAQLYYSFWTTHHAQDEGLQHVSKFELNFLIVSACF